MRTEAELRLAGRWDDALAMLTGRDDVPALVERVRVLPNAHLLRPHFSVLTEQARDCSVVQ